MIEHLEASCREVSAAAALATRRPSLETLEMLGQACELLELASEAVEAPPLAALGNRALCAANDLLSNLSNQVNKDDGDMGPALAYLEDCQTSCTMLLEECSSSHQTPMFVDPKIHEAMPASNSAATKALDASVLRSLQRHVLGLADECDQQELNNAGVAQDLEAKGSVSRERADDLPRRTAGGYLALDQHSASVQKDATTARAEEGRLGGANDKGAAEDSQEKDADAPSADALVRLWPGLAATARLKLSGEGSGSSGDSSDSHEDANDEYSIGGSPIGGGESAHRGYAKVAGGDAARAVGGLSAALGAVLAGLEEQHRLQRQLQGVRRLPPFARRDAMAALTSQLKALTAARTEACRTLTGLAQSTSLNALLPVSAKQATADALDALALAWQAARSDELGHSNHRSCSSSSGNEKSNSSRINRGASEAQGKQDFGESVRASARAAVGAAQEVLNDHASKRRNGLAAAGRPRPTVEESVGGEGRGNAGSAATVHESEVAEKGVLGDASFAVHLSRHCEFAPTFSDVAGLSVAVRRPPQASNGSNFLNPRAMYPQIVNDVNNNAAAAHKAWVLDHKQEQERSSGRYEPRSSRRIAAASNTMALVPGAAQQQQQKRVQRVSAGRRGLSEGKENGVAGKESGRFDLDGLGLALSASRVMPSGLR